MSEFASPVAALPAVQRYGAVAWPSFLAGAAATVVFFGLIDPVNLLHCEGAPPLSRSAAYTLGFFAFWMLTLASSAATCYFLSSRVPASRRQDYADPG